IEFSSFGVPIRLVLRHLAQVILGAHLHWLITSALRGRLGPDVNAVLDGLANLRLHLLGRKVVDVGVVVAVALEDLTVAGAGRLRGGRRGFLDGRSRRRSSWSLLTGFGGWRRSIVMLRITRGVGSNMHPSPDRLQHLLPDLLRRHPVDRVVIVSKA